MNTPLSLFASSDQVRLVEIYRILFELFKLLKPIVQNDTVTEAELEQMRVIEIKSIPSIARDLGSETLKPDSDERLPRAIHDIRGGCLAGVVSCYEMILSGIFPWSQKTAMQLFRMVRDHLKMFRNCVPEIDPETVARDRADSGHSIDLLTEKWQDAAYQTGVDKSLEVEYSCEYRGAISERCMEFSALDRIVYNCMNNASRFAVDKRVFFHVVEVDSNTSVNVLRFVIINRIPAGHGETLTSRFGSDLSVLFEARQSTDSSGYGLNICADFVASAFGLRNASTAVERKYIGAALQDDCFIVWFHWPTVV